MGAAQRAAAETTHPEGSEKRSAIRRPASQVPSITGLRLSPHGAEAKLVDISSSGLLAECTSRLKVGSSVAVLFEGTFSSTSVVGRIARCAVAAMGRDGVLRYHVGISFNKPIVLPDDPEVPAAVQESAPGAATASVESPAPQPAPAPVAAVRNRW
jgi:hypothetical protein